MARQLPESAMEPRPRRVTLDSEERCEKAFENWAGKSALSGTDAITAEFMRRAWYACWRYLERQVQKEFIER